MGKHYLIWMNMTIEPLIGGLIRVPDSLTVHYRCPAIEPLIGGLILLPLFNSGLATAIEPLIGGLILGRMRNNTGN